MARTDAIVLGAGIVGTSVALQLAKRGLAVALVDRRPPGEETSYGNAGIIEGNTVFPPAFPSDPMVLLRVALKRAPEANYHLTFLPHVAPWLLAFRAASSPQRLHKITRRFRLLKIRIRQRKRENKYHGRRCTQHPACLGWNSHLNNSHDPENKGRCRDDKIARRRSRKIVIPGVR